MAHKAAALPSQRQLRVGEEIRHILAGILARGDLHDPALAGRSITVSEVRASPDLRNATVFIMPLAGVAESEVLSALKRAAPHLSHQLGRQLRVKFTPRLTFQLDRSFDEADRITRLLRDLDPGDGPAAPAEDDTPAGTAGPDAEDDWSAGTGSAGNGSAGNGSGGKG